MQRKTINAIITKKMTEWWESIDDEELRKKVAKHTVVTGGCIASMLLGEPVNDYDVYISDIGVAAALANYYISKFKETHGATLTDKMPSMELVHEADIRGDPRIKVVVKSAGIISEETAKAQYEYFETRAPEEASNYLDVVMSTAELAELEEQEEAAAQEVKQGKAKYRPVFFSTNAITLAGGVQVVLRFTGTPKEIHANYDFAHCLNYWTKKEGVILNPDALEALLSKTLVYRGSRYPLCSIIRIRKFIQRGWSINAGQYLKMLIQLNEMDLTKFAVLEDQLTGVDQAYFRQVLDSAAKKEELTGAYLIEIIDRMF